ncbi:MAG: hypothetical protein PW786_10955 [Arachidicoccus sp.]|nr:hypothetical protein [Arachidicoccus sp.]MDE1192640.1 hypothetical protein [Arachidicoccus sp.]
MNQIRFRYRKIITHHNTGNWDRMAWEDSFNEFKMQFQRFNTQKKHHTYGTLLAENPQAAQLHFLVGGSVLGYLQQLNGIIPDIVNNLGLRFMPAADCQFEIINSDVRDINKHEVAFNFYSEPFLWHATIGSSLLVSLINKEKETIGNYDTHLFSIRPYVSIDKLNDTF